VAGTTGASSKWPGRTRPTAPGWWPRWPAASWADRSTATATGCSGACAPTGCSQPSRSPGRRRGPGFFRVTRLDAWWHLDMPKVWTAQHGWAMPAHHRRRLPPASWSAGRLRCAAAGDEAIARGRGSRARAQYSSWKADAGHGQWQPVHLAGFPPARVGRGIAHRYGGYRDPESPGVHRVVVWPVHQAPGVALAVGVAGPGEKGDHRIHRCRPPPVPLRAGYLTQPRSPPPGSFGHLDIAWEEPEIALFCRTLASFCRLITLDRRGTGASDPLPPDPLPPWESYAEELAAVLDEVGPERPALLAELDAGRRRSSSPRPNQSAPAP
jgi:hypothetical protein